MTLPVERPARNPAFGPYEHALRHGGSLHLEFADGSRLPLAVARWRSPADEHDGTLLRRCAGATLDVGCGPGRLVAALADRGLPALGIDPSPAAVEAARRRGGLALRRSVFDRLPGEERWSSVLLADGNIGIGGDPAALLRRCAALVRRGGRVLVETDTDPLMQRRFAARVAGPGGVGAVFRWARVGAARLPALAEASGLRARETWTSGGRTFVELAR